MPKRAELNGVSATSASDAWAVGGFSSSVGETPVFQTLIEHWDGTRWCRVASPDPGVENSNLWAVSALSADDAWAVGTYNASDGAIDTLIEHWDGKTWSQVPSPSPSVPYLVNYLFGVVAQSPSNVWAVGHYAVKAGQLALILHWNGKSWKQVTAPAPLQFNNLRAVAAYKANAWASGDSDGQTFTVERKNTGWIPVGQPDRAAPGVSGWCSYELRQRRLGSRIGQQLPPAADGDPALERVRVVAGGQPAEGRRREPERGRRHVRD